MSEPDARYAGTRNAPPFPLLWPLLAGALAGIALRIVFSGRAGHPYSSMMACFIYASPVVVGAVTVYVAERGARRSWRYYALASFVANCAYVLGTMLIMYEGLICAIVIIPLFALLGAAGGLLMGAVCRLTRWPKQTLYSVSVIPLIFGLLETAIPFPRSAGVVERSVVIGATPERIWSQILSAQEIEPAEIDDAWMFRIGVPLTESGRMLDGSEGHIRRVTMGKHIYFDEVITDSHQPAYLRWTYRFYPDSFPAGSLDEHVQLGGEYFDITDTSYTLTSRGEQTELTVRMHYRVSTRFNWYADPVARFLLGNLAGINAEYYRRRSEHDVPG